MQCEGIQDAQSMRAWLGALTTSKRGKARVLMKLCRISHP